MSEDIDLESLESVKSVMGDKFPQIVEVYLRNAKNYMQQISDAIEERDSAKVADNAHPMKSSSGMMGLAGLRALATEAEKAGRAGIEDFSKGSKISKIFSAMQDKADVGFKMLEEELKAF